MIILHRHPRVNHKSRPRVDKSSVAAHTLRMETGELRFRVARAGLHFYEEPFISGKGGSGTVFFTGCDLRCMFCQNHEISRGGKGVNISGEELLRLFAILEEKGAENINLVTPSPWTKQLIPVLERFKTTSELPVVWNSSGYEDVELLREAEGLVDVWLPDFKYSDDSLAEKYSGVKGYSARAFAAISEMRRQAPKDVFDKRDMMKKGVCVRHLVLPCGVDNAAGVMRAIARIDKNMFVSVMAQYFPTPAVANHPVLSRRITREEYDAAVEAFFAAGLNNGLSQDPESATEDYVPDFDAEEVLRLLGHD